MPAPRTLEIIDQPAEQHSSYPTGSTVEVTYNLPNLFRTITYIGTVAIRPEEKAEQSVVTKKFGEEMIIPMAATYTIKTTSKVINEYIETPQGIELLDAVNDPNVADLIFDPNHKGFSIVQIENPLPIPRSEP